MIIYLAGPYTDNPDLYVAHAIDIADVLAVNGHTPIVPHLFHFWNARHSHPWKFWMRMTTELLTLTDVVFRFPGPSKGADIEVDLAEQLGIPIFYDIKDLLDATE